MRRSVIVLSKQGINIHDAANQQLGFDQRFQGLWRTRLGSGSEISANS